MNISKPLTVLPLLGMTIGVGCSASAPSGPTPGNVAITAISIGTDGVQSVRQYEVTQVQYAAMADARRAQQDVAHGGTPTVSATGTRDETGVGQQAQAVITQDVCTDGNALWIYDQASCPSSPDYMLCLIGSGTNISLHNWYSQIPRPFPPGGFTYAYWDTRVYSFWPGNDAGALLDNSISYTQSFSANQSCTTAGAIDHMDAVTLN